MATKLTPTADDLEYFKRSKITDEKLIKRILMERLIIRIATEDLLKAGFTVQVDYGEGQTDGPFDTADDVMKNIMACDEERLHARKDGKRVGSVWLVFGNDGWDVIADNSTNLNLYLVRADAMSDELSGF